MTDTSDIVRGEVVPVDALHPEVRKLVIDCTGLGYISSVGVGVLVRLHKKLWTAGGHVKGASVRGPVFRILEMTKLAALFEIFPSVEEALGAFRRSG